jgi:hypothetical protein
MIVRLYTIWQYIVVLTMDTSWYLTIHLDAS